MQDWVNVHVQYIENILSILFEALEAANSDMQVIHGVQQIGKWDIPKLKSGWIVVEALVEALVWERIYS